MTTRRLRLRAQRSPLAASLIIIQSARAAAVAALMRGRAMVVPQLASAAVAGRGRAVLVAQLVPAP